MLDDPGDDVSSHADTIRRSLDYMHDRSGKNVRDQHAEALAHLDALLAENQRLRDALERISHLHRDYPLREAQIEAREALAGDAE